MFLHLRPPSLAGQDARRIRFTKATTKGAHHVITALVEIENQDQLASGTNREILQRQMRAAFDRVRTLGQGIIVDSRWSTCQGRECARVDFVLEDREKLEASGTILLLTGREYYLLHPDTPTVIAKLAYSQRLPKGESPLPIDAEVRPFLKSLVFAPLRAGGRLAPQGPDGACVAMQESPEPPGAAAQRSPKRDVAERVLAEIDLPALQRDSLTLSPDGKRVAYVLRVGQLWFAVVDGKAGKASTFAPSPIFSPDSRRVAYVAPARAGRSVVVDGQEGKPHTDIEARSLHFSPDSRRVAYAAREPDGAFIVVDEQEGKRYEAAWSPIFSPNGKRVAYGAAQGRKRFVVVDGQEGKPYSIAYGYVFSPDSKRVAYGAHQGRTAFVVVDGEERKPYEDLVCPPVFSPDSRRVAYVAAQGGKQVVVVDGQEGEPYDRISCPPIFSPDSRRVAYAAQVGPDTPMNREQFLVVDGKAGEPFDAIGTYRFSPDSTRVAYTGRVGTKWLVVTDGREGKAYDRILDGPVFSPDSKRVAYGAQMREKWFAVVDESARGPYDTMGTRSPGARIVFDSATALHYLALKGSRIYLVEEQIR